MPGRFLVLNFLFIECLLLSGCGPTAVRRPNVILILVDALRYDYVGTYGEADDWTPHVDRFAQECTRYRWAYTPIGMSGPAYTSLLTGLYPHEHGLLNNGQSVPSDVWWLPEELQNLGYQTAAFMSNAACEERFGFQRGFDHFWSDRSQGIEARQINRALFEWLPSRDPRRPSFLFLVYMDTHTPYITPDLGPNLAVSLDARELGRVRADNYHVVQVFDLTLSPGTHDLDFERLFPDRETLVAGEKIEEGTLNIVTLAITPETVQCRYERGWGKGSDRLEDARSIPQRARLVLTNPNNTSVEAKLAFQGLQEYTPEQLRHLYAKCVSFFDHHFGSLRESLQAEKLWDESLIIFFADHGQGLGQHGFLYHVDQLYDSILRIPLLVKWPGQTEGEVRAGPASLLDIPKSVLAAVGAPHDEIARLGGIDLAEISKDEDWWEKRILFAETYPPEAAQRLSAILFEGWKLIFNHDLETHELYNLVEDPNELNDLYTASPKPELEELLREWTEGIPLRADLRIEDLSQESIEELRAYGYLNKAKRSQTPTSKNTPSTRNSDTSDNNVETQESGEADSANRR
jgi:arylsulfatase A-like enzyme